MSGVSAGDTPSVLSSLLPSNSAPSSVLGTAGKGAAQTATEQGFLDSLIGNSKNFLSQPSNLITTAILGSSFMNRPKKPREKSPEELANEQKRYANALMLSPEELLQQEKHLLAKEQMRRRIERNKFLPEERLGAIEPFYARSHTPEEYKKKGKWFSYYNNPQFSGEPVAFKAGGEAQIPDFFAMEEMDPEGTGTFFEGMGGGQDDDLRVRLPEDSYIIDASTVSDLGDGNSNAGARKLDALVSDGEFYFSPENVTRLGKGDNKQGVNLLDKLVKNVRKHKGGSTKLPPKAKSLTSYMRGRHAK